MEHAYTRLFDGHLSEHLIRDNTQALGQVPFVMAVQVKFSKNELIIQIMDMNKCIQSCASVNEDI